MSVPGFDLKDFFFPEPAIHRLGQDLGCTKMERSTRVVPPPPYVSPRRFFLRRHISFLAVDFSVALNPASPWIPLHFPSPFLFLFSHRFNNIKKISKKIKLEETGYLQAAGYSPTSRPSNTACNLPTLLAFAFAFTVAGCRSFDMAVQPAILVSIMPFSCLKNNTPYTYITMHRSPSSLSCSFLFTHYSLRRVYDRQTATIPSGNLYQTQYF